MTGSDPAVQPGARSDGDSESEVERLRVELEHRDQLLVAVYARADALQREIELLERQTSAAIEAQREAATERSELRRLLGNAQLQVQSLLRIAPPGSESERAASPVAAQEQARVAVEGRSVEPVDEHRAAPEQAAPPAEPSPAASESPPEPAPAPAPERQRPRPAPVELRGIVDDAREAWASLRRLF